MSAGLQPKIQEIFQEIQAIVYNKLELTQQELHRVAELMDQLKTQYKGKGISFPASMLTPMNPESIQQYIKAEIDKLSVRYKRNKCKMSLFHLAYEVMTDSYLHEEVSKMEEELPEA